MNVLFCNIAWMKFYDGVIEGDKPINGGSYVKENDFGNEYCNFKDINGKCYGFVMVNGNMNLDLHYEEAKKNRGYLNDVLVVWVATNKFNETRIVGWYKNATVYSEIQYKEVYTDKYTDFYYRIEAKAEECCLIPENNRDFEIKRASQSGTGTGMGRSNVWYADSKYAKTILIPKVLEYIENYQGDSINRVFNDEVLNIVISKDKDIFRDYDKLIYKGNRFLNKGEIYSLDALKVFNTARNIKETIEVLNGIGQALVGLYCFDKAITIFNKVLEKDENNFIALDKLVDCYYSIEESSKVINCCEKLLSLEDNEEWRRRNIVYYYLMLNEYIYLRNEALAKKTLDRILPYSDDKEILKNIKDYKRKLKEVFKY